MLGLATLELFLHPDFVEVLPNKDALQQRAIVHRERLDARIAGKILKEKGFWLIGKGDKPFGAIDAVRQMLQKVLECLAVEWLL
jgi:hypothetical protein